MKKFLGRLRAESFLSPSHLFLFCSSTFTFAATDTTSTAISRTLHLLAHHKDAQDRLRQELRKARQDNDGEDISYDALVSLPYLDAICRETLRL